MTEEAGARECVICGAPATETALPSRPWIVRPDPDKPGYERSEQLPPYELCTDDLRNLAAGRISFGWCDAPACRRWGLLEAASPCGRPYLELPTR